LNHPKDCDYGDDPRALIKLELMARGFTPEEGSIVAGLPRGYLRNYFVGRPPTLPEWVRERLASRFDLSQEELTG
jgi:hypothetical protein